MDRHFDQSLLIKIYGSIFGTVIGDAFGLPFEFSSPSLSHDKLIDRRVVEASHWGYSDDTQMLISLLESLNSLKKFNEQHYLNQMHFNYEPARGYGKGMKRVFQHLDSGGEWTSARFTSWEKGSKGNGAAVRIAPLACYYHHMPISIFFSWIEQSAQITHAAEEALMATKIQAYTIKKLLTVEFKQLDRQSLIENIMQLDFVQKSNFFDKLSFVKYHYNPPILDKKVVIEKLGAGVLAEESQITALYCFLCYPDSFTEAISFAAKLGGDTDSICAMVGALSGAYLGKNNIPEQWIKNIESGPKGINYIETLITSLFNNQ